MAWVLGQFGLLKSYLSYFMTLQSLISPRLTSIIFLALHYLVCSIDSVLSKESKQINMIGEEILAVIDDRVQFKDK